MLNRFKDSRLLTNFHLILILIIFFSLFHRLWNELTIKLQVFIKTPAIQNEEALLKMYHNFISNFESK